MTSTKVICTPLIAFINLFELNTTQSELEKKCMSCVSYASVVSNLMYAMVCIRSNLAQAVNVVSRYMGNPGKKHWQDVKHIFRYLKGTTNIGLVYHGDISCALTCCLYSTNVIDLDARRSMTGHGFIIGNFLFSWKRIL